ncbi:MAG: hypothetical protein M3O89_04090 [Actinomycetota bacterium]|nr:hypothetical protein [Actinomycetota bacterium]
MKSSGPSGAPLWDRERALVIFTAATGLRPGEWIALEQRDVDRAARVVFVRRAFRNGRIKCPKTDGSIRAVPLQAIALGALEQLPAGAAGFSRSGATIGGGLLVGLSHRDAALFALLLATPIIGAAAALKLPELFGSQGDGSRGQGLVASPLLRRDRLPLRPLPVALLRDTHVLQDDRATFT